MEKSEIVEFGDFLEYLSEINEQYPNVKGFSAGHFSIAFDLNRKAYKHVNIKKEDCNIIESDMVNYITNEKGDIIKREIQENDYHGMDLDILLHSA